MREAAGLVDRLRFRIPGYILNILMSLYIFNQSTKPEKRLPFWLEGIVDTAQLMTYRLEQVGTVSALTDTEEGLKGVTQVSYLFNVTPLMSPWKLLRHIFLLLSAYSVDC